MALKENNQIFIPENLTYEDIRVQFYTGRFKRDHNSQDKRAGCYIRGIQTKIGDIEESVWVKYAEELIRRNNDEELFLKLKAWYKKTTPFLHNEKELHQYTIACFLQGLPDDPNWVDYEAFQEYKGA